MKDWYFDEVTKESVPHKEGLQDLLEYLKEHEIPAVVATSTERKRASRHRYVRYRTSDFECDLRRYGGVWEAGAGHFPESSRS